MDGKELNMQELDQVVGGFKKGRIYTVSGTQNFLGFRNDTCYDDSNIVRRYYNGDQLIYVGEGANGYVLVEDPRDGRVGYVNCEYLR